MSISRKLNLADLNKRIPHILYRGDRTRWEYGYEPSAAKCMWYYTSCYEWLHLSSILPLSMDIWGRKVISWLRTKYCGAVLKSGKSQAFANTKSLSVIAFLLPLSWGTKRIADHQRLTQVICGSKQKAYNHRIMVLSLATRDQMLLLAHHQQ